MPALLVGLGLLAGAALAYSLLRGRAGANGTTGSNATYRRLTNMPGAETSPSLSPDGQTLAFVHRSGKKPDIWIQRAGGRNPIDLTPDCDRESYSPAFSPDGTLIAYGAQCGEGGLFVMGATGENSRRLVNVGSNPAWSPDGKEILYSTELVVSPYGRTGTSEIWAVELSSGKTRKLSGTFDAIQPNVSPHGLRVAFWALPPGGSQRDIWTMPYKGLAAGEKPVPVTQDAAVDYNPVWGPDGGTLYFLSNRGGTMNLWRVPIDEATGHTLGEAAPEMLPAREVGGLAFSRDGRDAAYVVRENTFSIDRLTFEANGTLTGKPEPVLESSQEMADFDVSADGKFLAFDSRGGAQDDLFLLESDGKNLRQLTDDAPRDRGPNFSPDGKRLAFHSDRGGRYQIWTIERDGSGMKVLTQATELVIESHWSPDGRAIAVNSGHSSSILRLDDRGGLVRVEPIPAPTPETFFYPLAWTADGSTLVGALVRLSDLTGQAVAVYTPGPGAVVKTVPNTEAHSRVRRGAVIGNRYLLYGENDGLFVLDLANGDRRLVVQRPSNGSFQGLACARTSTTCYVVRSSDNADIWQRTEAAQAR